MSKLTKDILINVQSKDLAEAIHSLKRYDAISIAGSEFAVSAEIGDIINKLRDIKEGL